MKLSIRIFDFSIALFLLILLSPVLLIIAAKLKLIDKSQVFFVQLRTGYECKLFKLIKFKTMSDNTNKNGKLLKDNERITKFGNFLRNSSLDELPELLNILRGEMSLVGPRPLLPEYIPFYNSEEIKRHKVLPGITGWAQINGRNLLSWEKKFQYDLWYVNNQSLWLNIKILFLTLNKVIRKEGLNHDDDETMPKFKRIIK